MHILTNNNNNSSIHPRNNRHQKPTKYNTLFLRLSESQQFSSASLSSHIHTLTHTHIKQWTNHLPPLPQHRQEADRDKQTTSIYYPYPQIQSGRHGRRLNMCMFLCDFYACVCGKKWKAMTRRQLEFFVFYMPLLLMRWDYQLEWDQTENTKKCWWYNEEAHGRRIEKKWVCVCLYACIALHKCTHAPAHIAFK